MCVFMMVGSVQTLVHQQPPAGGTSRLLARHTGSSREASLLPSYPQLFTAVATTRTSDSLARNTTLSLSLPGLGVVVTTLRHLARPTTLLFIKWPALGLVQTMVQNTKICPEFLSWHPLPLTLNNRHNPGLISAPLWPTVRG